MAETELKLAPRNDPLGLAQRTWTNLEIIEKSFAGEERRGHVVTQLVSSLLTFIIFPKEDEALQKRIESHQLDVSKLNDWKIKQVLGTTPTLAKLFWHLRNATAHNRLKFRGVLDGNSRYAKDVVIEFYDRASRDAPDNWKIEMEVEGIRTFLTWIYVNIFDINAY